MNGISAIAELMKKKIFIIHINISVKWCADLGNILESQNCHGYSCLFSVGVKDW